MFEQYIEQINKIDQKVDLNIEFPEWNKTVQINVRECGCGIDGEDKVTSMYFVVKKGKVTETGEGEFYNADVIIDGEPPSIEGLFNGSLSVVGAYITKDLAIEGSVGDAVAVKVLLDAARLF